MISSSPWALPLSGDPRHSVSRFRSRRRFVAGRRWLDWAVLASLLFAFDGEVAKGDFADQFSDPGKWSKRVAEGWKSQGNGGDSPQAAEISVQSDNPLSADGGAYLKVAVSSEGTNKRWAVLRPHFGLSGAYTLSFLYRLDEAVGGHLSPDFGKMMFFQWNGIGSPLLASAENATWAIQSTRESAAPEWIFSNGAGFDGSGNIIDGKGSGVLLNMKDAYLFELFVEPEKSRYKATVRNLSHREGSPGAADFTSEWLDFAWKGGSVDGAFVFLEHKRRNSGVVAFSLDDVKLKKGAAEGKR